ncbi:MAG: HepT-like ribonuclease domain-containing protein [Chitinophagaceae bacterium]
MTGTRDGLIHDHFGFDFDMVWDISHSKLPDLKNEIMNLFKKAAEQSSEPTEDLYL